MSFWRMKCTEMPRDAPGVMFALFHGRWRIRASRYANGPNAASRRLLNFCHFLLPVRRRSSNAAPVLSRRLTRRRTERTVEVGLARKLEGQRNLDQRLVALLEQLFGALKPLRADIVMRRSADRGLERAGKMEAAQARDRSQAGECQITFQIGSDVIEHTRQSALIKSCLSCRGGDIARQRADVLLDQPCRQARGQRFDEDAPHRCLTLKFGRDCIGHLGDEWVLKAAFIAQRRDRGRIGSFAQALRRELAWRKIDMQYCRLRLGYLN